MTLFLFLYRPILRANRQSDRQRRGLGRSRLLRPGSSSIHLTLLSDSLTRAFTCPKLNLLSFSFLRHRPSPSAVHTPQAKLTPDQIDQLAAMLDIPAAFIHDQLGAHWWPNRGLGPSPPSDPVIYRLYEGVMVYGQPIKVCLYTANPRVHSSSVHCLSNTQAVLHEKVRPPPSPISPSFLFCPLLLLLSPALKHKQFGDGIMSMINCSVTVNKKEDPAGDRVLLTFECVLSLHSFIQYRCLRMLINIG